MALSEEDSRNEAITRQATARLATGDPYLATGRYSSYTQIERLREWFVRTDFEVLATQEAACPNRNESEG